MKYPSTSQKVMELFTVEVMYSLQDNYMIINTQMAKSSIEIYKRERISIVFKHFLTVKNKGLSQKNSEMDKFRADTVSLK